MRVVTFTADLGQGEELDPARQKALKFGIKPEQIYIDDLREEFVRDFVLLRCFAPTPCTRANTCSAPRSRAADRQAPDRDRQRDRRRRICHGATGKGNDQVRFELGAYALKPTSR